jgi:hypothetical protein
LLADRHHAVGRGWRNLRVLNRLEERVGLTATAPGTALVARSSLDWAPADFCAAALPRFRWFSVDGGHTEAATRHDMHLGACHLAEGGILAVDDVLWFFGLCAASSAAAVVAVDGARR